jgi:hypothetical protein
MQILIVVREASKAAAEAAVAQVDSQSIGETFTIRLSATGAEPVTHFACQPNVTANGLEAVQQIARAFAGARVFVAESQADHLPMIERSLAAMGLQKVEAE